MASGNTEELSFHQVGEQQCRPGYSYGPAVRDHYVVHLCLSGQGQFRTRGSIFRIRPGQAFLIVPHAVSQYEADREDPWHYAWIGFRGVGADHYLADAGLTASTPVVELDDIGGIAAGLREAAQLNPGNKGLAALEIAAVYRFMGQIQNRSRFAALPVPLGQRQRDYVFQAAEEMRRRFTQNLTIDQVATRVGVDRSYLGALFKKQTGISMQHWLIRLRMGQACDFLRNPDLSVTDIAHSVGYEDALLFSKMFRKTVGTPPSRWRLERNPEHFWPIDHDALGLSNCVGDQVGNPGEIEGR